MIALCSKTYCCYDEETDTVKLSSKGLNKSNIEEPLNKYRKVLFNEEREFIQQIVASELLTTRKFVPMN